MKAEEDPASVDSERDDEDRRAKWSPWIAFLVILLVVVWLIWHYSRTPESTVFQRSGAAVAAATVPDVVGLYSDEAVAVLDKAGFLPEVDSSNDSGVDPGKVASQKPRAGSTLARNSIVVIVVAANTGSAQGTSTPAAEFDSQIPNVVGMTQARAEEVLKNSGFGIMVLEVYSDEQPRGLISDQSPVAGSPSTTGVTVGVTLSLGPASTGSVKVPNLVDMNISSAISELEKEGLDPRPMFQPRADREGVVYEQSPAAGELVPKGSKVFILAGETPGM